jgi:hypothetical protein
LTGGGGDRGIDHSRYFRRGLGRSKALGVERCARRVAMQTGDEHGQREAFGGADSSKRLRLEKRAKAGLCLLACLRPPIADRIQRGAGLDAGQRIDDIRECRRHRAPPHSFQSTMLRGQGTGAHPPQRRGDDLGYQLDRPQDERMRRIDRMRLNG